jgi:RHH-type rel operon transcriptional repressor/antitoxin RelB
MMLTVRLPCDLEKRLVMVARRTGLTKTRFAREAILRHIDDIEDYYLAKWRLAHGGPRVPLEDVGGSATKRSSPRKKDRA